MDSAAKEEVHVKNPLTVLKDLLSLTGNVNQTLNQFCRSLEFLKLVNKSEESSAWLFGDCIMATVESLVKQKLNKNSKKVNTTKIAITQSSVEY